MGEVRARKCGDRCRQKIEEWNLNNERSDVKDKSETEARGVLDKGE
jgi:hypothetical protein